MKTLTLKETAALLKMTPEGLRRKAANGEIPAAKPGKCWCFIEDDIADYLRSHYPSTAKTSWGVLQQDRRTLWHSTKEEIHGGLTLDTLEKDYNEALELTTK